MSNTTQCGPRPTPVADRIHAAVTITETGCWEWNKFRQHGYGRMSVGSRARGDYRVAFAHRVSYETFVAPILPGLHVDHLCRNRACVNPEHLEAVTPQVNARRRALAQRVAKARADGVPMCERGHEQTPLTIRYVKGRATCGPCSGRIGR